MREFYETFAFQPPGLTKATLEELARAAATGDTRQLLKPARSGSLLLTDRCLPALT